MENTKRNNIQELPTGQTPKEEKSPRQRSMTTLKLQWVAERVRKCRRIQDAIADGTYNVSSKNVAKAILMVPEDNIAEDDLQ